MIDGSDSKQYLGQSEVNYLVRDEIASFDPYSDWKSFYRYMCNQRFWATIFLITNPSAKVGSAAHQVFTESDNKSLHHTSTGRYSITSKNFRVISYDVRLKRA
jgi:hypothetical protein